MRFILFIYIFLAFKTIIVIKTKKLQTHKGKKKKKKKLKRKKRERQQPNQFIPCGPLGTDYIWTLWAKLAHKNTISPCPATWTISEECSWVPLPASIYIHSFYKNLNILRLKIKLT